MPPGKDKGVFIGVRVTKKLDGQITHAARSRGMTKNDLIREILAAGIVWPEKTPDGWLV